MLKMKTHEITSEMAHPAGDYTASADHYASLNKDTWMQQGNNIADMDNFTIRKYKNTYSVWDNDTLVACADILPNEIPTVDNVWVNENYRGQRLFAKLIWFFITRLNYKQLLLGESHSALMREAIKNLSNVPKVWYNVKTKQTEPFSIDTMDKYYAIPFNEWMLMFTENGLKDWPMRNGKGFTKESYEGNVF